MLDPRLRGDDGWVMRMQKIGIIGAGAWGTALAATLARAGRDVILWAREAEVVAAIGSGRENKLFLPGIQLPDTVVATGDMAAACRADAVLLVTPSQALRAVLKQAAPLWQAAPAVICAKGIEEKSHALMSEIAAEALPGIPLAILSGPTFAAEVARGLPTAITLACADQELGHRLVEAIGTTTFRPYLSDDLVGAQIGGSVKNVLAIGCGIVEGRGLGDNARAALLTRGLAEIMRLAAARGGKPETLMGLAGLGDLMLTATSTQSRNFSLGFAIGEGRKLDEVLSGRISVAEGVYTARSVLELARDSGIEMPLCEAINALLHEGADLDCTIQGLLSRPFKSEGLTSSQGDADSGGK
jgi:glycerol-3-phosphate dehydrogenase (NAD(P)+)